MSQPEPVPSPVPAGKPNRGARRWLLPACVVLVGSLAALVKSQVDRLQEGAARTHSI